MTKKELEARHRRFLLAANWLTGATGNFEPFEKDKQSDGTVPPFWFRSQFVRRAGLKWDRKKLRYV